MREVTEFPTHNIADNISCLLSPVDNEFTRAGLTCRISDYTPGLLNYNLSSSRIKY